jgi:hypothetical protein
MLYAYRPSLVTTAQQVAAWPLLTEPEINSNFPFSSTL